MDERASVHKSALTRTIPDFESFTKKFLASPLNKQIACPSCKNSIDFNKPITWHGPDTFICTACDRYLSMRLIQRALRDLGRQSFEITEI